MESNTQERLDHMTDNVMQRLNDTLSSLDTSVVEDMLVTASPAPDPRVILAQASKSWKNSVKTRKITANIVDALEVMKQHRFSIDMDNLPSAEEMLACGQEVSCYMSTEGSSLHRSQEFLIAVKKHFKSIKIASDIRFEDVKFVLPVAADGGVQTVPTLTIHCIACFTLSSLSTRYSLWHIYTQCV